MKILLLLCACAALTAASTLNESGDVRDRRFLASVSSFFTHAFNTVKDGVQTAAHAVKDAAETAYSTVKGAAHTALGEVKDVANTVIGEVTDVAHTVEGAVVHAAHKVSDFTSEATQILAPVLDKLSGTVGTIAKEVLDASLQQLKDQAPAMLQALGEAGLHELVTSVLTSAVAGKRDVTNDVEALKSLFAHLVQTRVNETVKDVKKVVVAVEKFNADLRGEIGKFEHLVRTDQASAESAKKFFLSILAKVQPLIDSKAFDMDVSRFDKIVPAAIDHFHRTLQQALQHSASRRGLLSDLTHDVMGLVTQGQQQLGQLVGGLKQLTSGLLTPTVDSVKHVAQTLLDNAGSVTSSLVAKATQLLEPFRSELGPLFQQIEALGVGLVGR